MTWKRNVLVVANVTAASTELIGELCARGEHEPTAFTLIVPATPFGGGRAVATETLSLALAQLREAGLEADGSVGAPDPIVAVSDVWDPKRYDEIVVSTLPMRLSKWLHAGLPERIGKLTGAPVTHIVSQPPKPAVATMPAPPERPAAMGPLTVLGWGSQKHR
ncbi:MAG TPA: hypothetical protein VGI87_04330 [Solirubrobacteraceae bacterium]